MPNRHGTRGLYADGCRCAHCAAATACDPDLQVTVTWDGRGYLLVEPPPPLPEPPALARYAPQSTAPVLAVFQTQGPLTVRDVWRALWPTAPYQAHTPRYRALYHQVDALRRRGKVVRVGRSPQGTRYQRAEEAPSL